MKPKKLKYRLPLFRVDEEESNRPIEGNPFIDSEDVLLAEEHSGFYIITIQSHATKYQANRQYMSLDKKLEYYNKRLERGDNLFRELPQASTLDIMDIYPEDTDIIRIILGKIIEDPLGESTVKEILSGMSIFFKCLKNLNKKLDSIEEINNELQILIYKEYIALPDKVKSDHRRIRNFFGRLEDVIPGFIATNPPEICPESEPIKALHTSIIYQLDMYAREDINIIIEGVTEYNEWMDELETIDLFSLENLAKTYYSRKGIESVGFNRVLRKVCLAVHNIDLRQWEKEYKKDKYTYKNDKQKRTHLSLIKKAKNGINIEITSEKMFAFWHKSFYPKYPYVTTLDTIFNSIDFAVTFRTRQYSRLFNKSIDSFLRRIRPTLHDIYPLLLLLLIREGVNSEVLFSWKVNKDEKGKYSIGDTLPSMLIIEGLKKRANSVQVVAMQNQSVQKRYIDFYLKWLTPLYNHSKTNHFFQYIKKMKEQSQDPTAFWTTVLFHSSSKSDDHFYKRYKIYDINNERVNNIDHRRIRASSNYGDYLKGLSEFERQYKKGHRDIDMQIHYENNIEWSNQKKHNIARSQDLIVSVFKGEITRDNHRVGELFEGILANCKSPEDPTYSGAVKLKDNEVCTDFFKCLTQCDKSVVIPKIHGEMIYAWINFMDEAKKLYFLRDSDWEKEYRLDYDAAKSATEGFTEEEENYAKERAFKHKDVVRRKFSKRAKIIRSRA